MCCKVGEFILVMKVDCLEFNYRLALIIALELVTYTLERLVRGSYDTRHVRKQFG